VTRKKNKKNKRNLKKLDRYSLVMLMRVLARRKMMKNHLHQRRMKKTIASQARNTKR
jgi:hypothetical protein